MHEPAGRVMAPRTCPHCGGHVPPDRIINLPDLMALLALCRDALDKGHGDLTRAVLHSLVEHQQSAGVRARNMARRLVEMMAEREQQGRSTP
jgi:hypothetical protein